LNVTEGGLFQGKRPLGLRLISHLASGKTLGKSALVPCGKKCGSLKITVDEKQMALLEAPSALLVISVTPCFSFGYNAEPLESRSKAAVLSAEREKQLSTNHVTAG
jgi:hypothetical protein